MSTATPTNPPALSQAAENGFAVAPAVSMGAEADQNLLPLSYASSKRPPIAPVPVAVAGCLAGMAMALFYMAYELLMKVDETINGNGNPFVSPSARVQMLPLQQAYIHELYVYTALTFAAGSIVLAFAIRRLVRL